MKLLFITEAGAMRRKPNIRFISWSSDGNIVVQVDGVTYRYNISAHYHDRLKRIAQYAPFRAFNEIKNISNNQ